MGLNPKGLYLSLGKEKENFCVVFTYGRVKLGRLIGNLSKDVFERRTLTGSEAYSLFICLDANKFV